MMFDYLIVGCGLYGSVCARQLADKGFKCLVIDKRNHIGGNCYTEKIDKINVHKYGAHIFHTSDENVWNYVNKYAKFNNYINRPKLIYNKKIYSFPLNLFSFYQIFGCYTPEEVHKKLESVRIKNDNPANLEEWILDKVGYDIYEIFFRGYTTKQWGRQPKDLPASIIKRLPIRFNFNDNYYSDCYQGVPIGGYTALFEQLLQGIEVRLETNYFSNREYFNNISKKIIYTGSIDEFYNYKYGMLNYRSLLFENTQINIRDYQGNAVINYSNIEIPYTRIIEHKHFEFTDSETTIITKEFPQEWSNDKERLYPINNTENEKMFDQYRRFADNEKNIIFGGRLANYRYYDMDKIVALALEITEKEHYE
jgi:UDP-galactopyranose mutase